MNNQDGFIRFFVAPFGLLILGALSYFVYMNNILGIKGILQSNHNIDKTTQNTNTQETSGTSEYANKSVQKNVDQTSKSQQKLYTLSGKVTKTLCKNYLDQGTTCGNTKPLSNRDLVLRNNLGLSVINNTFGILQDTSIPITERIKTDENGNYLIKVPEGSYSLFLVDIYRDQREVCPSFKDKLDKACNFSVNQETIIDMDFKSVMSIDYEI